VSYLQFHLVFILPPLVLLAGTLRGPLRASGKPIWPLFLLALIAFIYTTPWDNYLVWRGVWGYGTDRVLGTIGYVPYEEYAFFILQPFLTGLWLYHVLARDPEYRPGGERVRIVGGVVYGAIAGLGFLLLGTTSGLYAGLILAWAVPVLAGQWLYAGSAIWARRRAVLLGIAVPTLYLWVADGVAIALGIWEISERYTVGIHFGPLPLEEALFFLVTNILIVQGLVLFLHPRINAPRAAPPPAVAR
jgi:lycopene beta-cyclase